MIDRSSVWAQALCFFPFWQDPWCATQRLSQETLSVLFYTAGKCTSLLSFYTTWRQVNSVSLRVSRNQHKTSWEVSEEFTHVSWSAKQSSFRAVKRREFQARLHTLGQRADWATPRDPVSERSFYYCCHHHHHPSIYGILHSCGAQEQVFCRTFSLLPQWNQLTTPADSLSNVRTDEYAEDVSAALSESQNRLETRRWTPLTASFLQAKLLGGSHLPLLKIIKVCNGVKTGLKHTRLRQTHEN